MAQNYECVLLMDPGLSAEAVQSHMDYFSSQIRDNGGEIVHVQMWEKRRLAYPIASKGEAIYGFLYFRLEDSAGSLVDEFERRVRIDDSLLRQMTIKVPELNVVEIPPAETAPFGPPKMRRPRPRMQKPSAPVAEADAPAPSEEGAGEEAEKPATEEAEKPTAEESVSTGKETTDVPAETPEAESAASAPESESHGEPAETEDEPEAKAEDVGREQGESGAEGTS